MNERVQNDPQPARKLRPEISPQLQEILYRALERDPRHRYATAQEMAWELEHQDQVGVEEGERRSALGGLHCLHCTNCSSMRASCWCRRRSLC